jgi:hypothetical protein
VELQKNPLIFLLSLPTKSMSHLRQKNIIPSQQKKGMSTQGLSSPRIECVPSKAATFFSPEIDKAPPPLPTLGVTRKNIACLSFNFNWLSAHALSSYFQPSLGLTVIFRVNILIDLF